MDKVISYLNKAIKTLMPYMGFANSHMVDFFNRNLWEHYVPYELRDEFTADICKTDVFEFFNNSIKYNDNYLNKFLNLCFEAYTKQTDDIILDFETFSKTYLEVNFKSSDLKGNNTFMSEKKEHEVNRMSMAVAALSYHTNTSHLIDMGDGKGYLSSRIAMKYGLKVLGVDSCDSKTLAAAIRANMIKKHYSDFQENTANTYSPPAEEHSYSTINVQTPLYKQKTVFISAQTDLKGILTEAFPEDKEYKLGLIGLHTCGNLSPVSLKLFASNIADSKFLINVGCCYHFLEESDNDGATFPLSNYLKKANFKLGRNARMLSLQAPERLYSSKKVADSLMFRAVFQSFLNEKMGISDMTDFKVGRIGSKCKTFDEYCRKGLKKLGLSHNFSCAEFQTFFEGFQNKQPLLEYYYMLRVSIAPIIENIILLDRLLYLHENGLKKSFIVKLFDPSISPRCYAIISIAQD